MAAQLCSGFLIQCQWISKSRATDVRHDSPCCVACVISHLPCHHHTTFFMSGALRMRAAVFVKGSNCHYLWLQRMLPHSQDHCLVMFLNWGPQCKDIDRDCWGRHTSMGYKYRISTYIERVLGLTVPVFLNIWCHDIWVFSILKFTSLSPSQFLPMCLGVKPLFISLSLYTSNLSALKGNPTFILNFSRRKQKDQSINEIGPKK